LEATTLAFDTGAPGFAVETPGLTPEILTLAGVAVEPGAAEMPGFTETEAAGDGAAFKFTVACGTGFEAEGRLIFAVCNLGSIGVGVVEIEAAGTAGEDGAGGMAAVETGFATPGAAGAIETGLAIPGAEGATETGLARPGAAGTAETGLAMPGALGGFGMEGMAPGADGGFGMEAIMGGFGIGAAGTADGGLGRGAGALKLGGAGGMTVLFWRPGEGAGAEAGGELGAS
jgi:hypothetical protein